jgi:glycerol-3-phosphate cytidylyltransferase
MKQYKIGITFGAFDPLHYGHIKLFERAKEQCEVLYVIVSNDEYIRKHKGRPERVPLRERLKAVASVRYVDKLGAQGLEGGTKKAFIDEIRPDVIFVGSDWTPETFTGEGLGVPVVYLPHTDGISSTKLTS